MFLSLRVPFLLAMAFLFFSSACIANVATTLINEHVNTSPTHIRYTVVGKDELRFAKQSQYLSELLHLALSKSGVSIQLKL